MYYIHLFNLFFLGDILNHSKIILVACISAFVAVTTAVLGVAGTIIGSVLSSVLYNVLSEALEKPVQNAKISTNFEWDIAYAFPLIVILLIQLLLILALLSELGILPQIFLNVYLSIQGVTSNNLYRILGLSLVIMSVYPFILKRNNVKKSDGLIILFIGIIFLIRGFSDIFGSVSSVYGYLFDFVDFPIAIIAFLLLIYVIRNILLSSKSSEGEVYPIKHTVDKRGLEDLELKRTYRQRPVRNLDDLELRQVPHRNQKRQSNSYPHRNSYNDSQKRKINESADGFHFESNDLLDDYKK